MSGFGNIPTTTTQSSLPANQFPTSSVAVPGNANGDLTAMEGGPASTDANGNKTAPVSTYTKDGADVTQGTSTDANTANTLMGRLTKLRDILLGLIGQQTKSASLSVTIASDQGALPVSGTFWQATQPVSGTMTATQTTGSNLHTVVDSASNVAVTSLPALPTGTNTIGTVAVSNLPATQPVSGSVSVSNLPATQAVSGSVSVSNLPATQNIAGTGTAGSAASGVVSVQGIASMTPVKVDGSGVTQPVSGTFWQSTQPVSATSLPLPSGAATSAKQPALGTAGSASSDVLSVQGVASMTPLKTDGSGVTQPVSGSVSIQSNASMNVSQVGGASVATAASGVQKVGLSDGSGNAITSTSNAIDVNIKSGGGSGFSVADESAWTAGSSAFIPTGGVYNDSATALTSGQEGAARLTTNRALHSNLRSAAGVELATASNPLQVSLANTATNSTPVKVDGSGVTQPVSGSVTATVSQATGSNLHTTIDSGTVTATTNADTAIGGTTAPSKELLVAGKTNDATAQYQPIPEGAGGRSVIVEGYASGTAVPVSAVSLPLPSGAATSAKQPALGTAGTPSSDVLTVQGVSSMTPLKVDGSGVTQPVSGTFWQATQPVSGTVSVSNFPGTQPVSGTVAATQSGTWTVQPGNTQNTTPWLTQDVVASANGAVPHHNVTTASTNFNNVEASACQLYGAKISNTSASIIYVKVYNKASAPATTDTPVETYMIPAGAFVPLVFPKGLKFSTGFGWGATGAASDSDGTSIAAGCIVDFELNI